MAVAGNEHLHEPGLSAVCNAEADMMNFDSMVGRLFVQVPLISQPVPHGVAFVIKTMVLHCK